METGAAGYGSGHRCLVIGASGYVGSRLVPQLLDAGYEVRCLARDPARLDAAPFCGQVKVVQGDVVSGTGLTEAVDGVDVVYYLVHSLSRRDFRQADETAAELVAQAAADAGVGRIVYLGGLRPVPDDVPSRHLASRAEVGDIFLHAPVPAAVLQAGVITGSGSTSFEMVRYLTDRLPLMITPRWVRSRTQPIAIADVLRYLLGCADLPAEVNRTFDIGGPDVLTYMDMMQRYARIAGLPVRLALPVPILTPWLSSWWVALITPVSRALAEPLIESLSHDLTCREHDIAGHVPDPPGGLLDYEQSVRRALTEGPAQRSPAGDDPAASRPTDPPGAGGPVFTEHRTVLTQASPAQLWQVIESLGDRQGWHTVPFAWEVRGWIDQLLGGVGAHRGRRDPQHLRPGEVLDWWRVEEVEHGRRLLLRAELRMPGTAWLECKVGTRPGGGTEYHQNVTFVPAGLAGHLYWWAQRPLHDLIFGLMAHGIAHAAERASSAPRLQPA
ncbi:MAG: SDR family oxidoreductase [Pseudonocardiaceae bacterium]